MSDRDDTSDTPPSTCNDRRATGTPVEIRFEEIAQGEMEVLIEYREQRYRLRATKNGKLILNK